MLTMLAIDSPLGTIDLYAIDDTLVGLYLPEARWPLPTRHDAIRGTCPVLERAAVQLGEYFAGTRRDFDIALAARGTGFQRLVWRALETIPYGETWSYGTLARAIGRPAASRAVGAANGKNPISILVPCHRVIGASGELTGYGGGMAAKQWLLAHERDRRL